MYIILTLLFLSLFLYRWFSLYSCFFLALFYYLWYSDGKEYTGERKWDQFRRLFLWRWLSPVSYYGIDQAELGLTPRKLFVIVPCVTPMPMLWTFGLHGGAIPADYNMTFVLPPIFFAIPVMRDLLMWMGAVTYRQNNSVQSALAMLKDLFAMNRSVCWSPSGFGDLFRTYDAESPIQETSSLTEEFLDFARKNAICLIPVVVQHERQRYTIVSGILYRIQQYCYLKWGYPLPLLFWIKLFDRQKPPRLVVQWGAMIHCEKYSNTEDIDKQFKATVNGFHVTGDKIIKPS